MENTEDIHAQYQFTVKEVRKALAWFGRLQTSGLLRTLPLVVGISMIALGLYVLSSSLYKPHAGVLALWLGVLILVLRRIRLWGAVRAFQKSPGCDSEWSWTLGPERILARGPHSSSEIAWSAFVRVAETRDGFLLLPSDQIFYWLPREAFRDEVEFRRLGELARDKAKDFRRLS